MFNKPEWSKIYNKVYFNKNKVKILERRKSRRKEQYINFVGHIGLIHDAIRRYATIWNLSIDGLRNFKIWTLNDKVYEELFEAWEKSDFSLDRTPVVLRRLKKKGFTISNLYWASKNKDDWWNRELGELTREITTNWYGSIKTKYGLTRQQWNNLILQSNGHCMICNNQFKNASNDCHIDHNHESGEVRGLLCARCNHMLAGFDDKKFNVAASKYLETN